MLARWISDFDCELATQFWYIIRTGSYEIEQLSKSTRKHIRQAFKKCYVRKIEDNEIGGIVSLCVLICTGGLSYVGVLLILRDRFFIDNINKILKRK